METLHHKTEDILLVKIFSNIKISNKYATNEKSGMEAKVYEEIEI